MIIALVSTADARPWREKDIADALQVDDPELNRWQSLEKCSKRAQGGAQPWSLKSADHWTHTARERGQFAPDKEAQRLGRGQTELAHIFELESELFDRLERSLKA
jgi:hypothetical protein